MSSRVSVTPAGYGTELEITSVELEDAGQYECTASNSETGPPASRVITIIVQCKFQQQAKIYFHDKQKEEQFL